MDQRQTFGTSEELKAILANPGQSPAKVSLLLDRDGLTRLEGTIESMDENNPYPEILINTGNQTIRVYLREIIAVNGIFRSDYTEC